MIVGIVGSEAAKFTPETELLAQEKIQELLTRPGVTGVSSGRCHLGGVDVWAEAIGKKLGLETHIFPPAQHNWTLGYKPRNIKIAEASDEVHCITLAQLPPFFKGMRWNLCYHCGTKAHVKSGGCWTVRYAMNVLKKPGFWHVI